MLAYGQAEEAPPESAAEHTSSAVAESPVPTPPAQAAGPGQPAPRTTEQRRGILLMPYLGFSIPVGNGLTGQYSSPRFGGLLGWQVGERVSVNGECDVDYGDGFLDPRGHFIDLTISPLVSFGKGQLRLGPKIGWFTGKESKDAMSQTTDGLLFGFNLGLFVPYRGVMIGGLFTGSFRIFTSADPFAGARHTLGLVGGVLL